MQDLCVDVSLSESQGMRQLQQTVERLANRVACVSTDTEAQKCRLLSVSHSGFLEYITAIAPANITIYFVRHCRVTLRPSKKNAWGLIAGLQLRVIANAV